MGLTIDDLNKLIEIIGEENVKKILSGDMRIKLETPVIKVKVIELSDSQKRGLTTSAKSIGY